MHKDLSQVTAHLPIKLCRRMLLPEERVQLTVLD